MLFQMMKRIPHSFIHSFAQDLLSIHHVPDSGPCLLLGTTETLRCETLSISLGSLEFIRRDADSYNAVRDGQHGSKAERHPTHCGREKEGPWSASQRRRYVTWILKVLTENASGSPPISPWHLTRPCRSSFQLPTSSTCNSEAKGFLPLP